MRDLDGMAWRWLMALQRLDWQTVSRREADGQVLIRAIPHGNIRRDDGSRVAPFIQVSVSFPNAPRRFRGSGNDLYSACHAVQAEMWRAGLRDVPMLETTAEEPTR